MTADIEEGAQAAIAAAEQDDGLARDVAEPVVAGLGELRCSPDAVPLTGMDPLQFLGEQPGRGVILARQGASTLLVTGGGSNERQACLRDGHVFREQGAGSRERERSD